MSLAKRIENLANALKAKASELIYCSIVRDGSADIFDTAQLATFIRGIDKEFNWLSFSNIKSR